jgi:hypothetical protein
MIKMTRPPKITIRGPNISKQTLKEMKKFFSETSLPRIYAERQKEATLKQNSEGNASEGTNTEV